MMASEVTDLPEPDSPTTASVFPGCTSKLTFLTALEAFSPRPNSTESERTDSKGSSAGPCLAACSDIDTPLKRSPHWTNQDGTCSIPLHYAHDNVRIRAEYGFACYFIAHSPPRMS